MAVDVGLENGNQYNTNTTGGLLTPLGGRGYVLRSLHVEHRESCCDTTPNFYLNNC